MPAPFTIQISPAYSELERLLHAAEAYLQPCELTSERLATVRLALEEIITNTIKYGYDDGVAGEILVTMEVTADGIDILMDDDGREFNPLTHGQPAVDADLTQRPVGGLGIHLVRQKADELTYQRYAGRNRLRIVIRRR